MKEPLDPPFTVTPLDTVTLLANELNQLSMDEREKVYYDVHGVAEMIEETPEFLDQRFHELDQELTRLALFSKVYQEARQQDAKYVENPRFRLQFLRAGNFQPKHAAKRLLKFLEEKKKFFGMQKLTKDLDLDDLEPDDLKCLETGLMQVLPLPDRGGRTILIWIPMLRGNSTAENRVSKILIPKRLPCFVAFPLINPYLSAACSRSKL